MKSNNLRVQPTNPADLDRIFEEYVIIGYDVEKRGDHLIVHSIPRSKKNIVRKKREAKGPGRQRPGREKTEQKPTQQEER